MNTTVRFLGTAAAVPDPGRECATFILNDRYLVDTGWNVAGPLRAFGVDPSAVEYLFLTHCHQDHYLGLPSLLFYRMMKRAQAGGGAARLKIIGPEEDVARVAELALAFLQPRIFPGIENSFTVIPLKAGETYEDPAFTLAACATRHPVPGLCYRFTDRSTGATVAFTGDTAPFDGGAADLLEQVRGAGLLIHDATYGAKAAPTPNPGLHSGAPDAARLALAAGVGRLALIHSDPRVHADACRAAREIFAESFWPEDGEVVTLP